MELRNAQWYAGENRSAYIHRAWMRRGVPDDAFDRPQIAIANTASDLTPCNAHLTEVAAAARNSIYEATGSSSIDHVQQADTGRPRLPRRLQRIGGQPRVALTARGVTGLRECR